MSANQRVIKVKMNSIHLTLLQTIFSANCRVSVSLHGKMYTSTRNYHYGNDTTHYHRLAIYAVKILVEIANLGG